MVALQELKAGEISLEFNLRNLIQGAKVIIDYSQSVRGGAALLIDLSLQGVNSGIHGKGWAAWAITQSEVGRISFISVYGPHRPREKLEFLEWLRNRPEDVHWVFLGDWNFMIEPEDTAGPTAWPRVVRGNHLDQARLDRVYISHNGDWVRIVQKITHNGKECASDHIHVKADFMLTSSERSNRRKVSYLKLDVESFRDPEMRDLIRSAWEEGWGLFPNPIVAWELAWGRVRKLFRRFRKEEQSRRSKLQAEQAKLEDLRIQMAENPSSVNLDEYRQLESKVKETELLESRILCRRSRQTWIKSGDACSNYFFAALKSKQTKEKIPMIVTEDSNTVTEQD
ncbi:hypothetical protein R1sor_019202 [Riccia sorocarpa]|uniref:Endonuclease/exonuclease/phosphatase domain-containing protein n=1 Tax=Riccia sorocarpa TaxID=122646 RepID=A0ABD3IFM8_9MARC